MVNKKRLTKSSIFILRSAAEQHHAPAAETADKVALGVADIAMAAERSVERFGDYKPMVPMAWRAQRRAQHGERLRKRRPGRRRRGRERRDTARATTIELCFLDESPGFADPA